MQRVNDNDLSAHVLALKEEHYVHLKIEAEATSHTTITFPRTGHILVREPQELLWPTREGPLEIARQKAVMSSSEPRRRVPPFPRDREPSTRACPSRRSRLCR